MRRNPILFAGLAAWISRGISLLLGLILMPALFRCLSKEELGLWLLLNQSWVALGVFDLGFGVVLTRRLAFVLSEAASDNAGERRVPARTAADLLTIGRRVYRGLALLAFVVTFASGYLYLRNLELHGVPVWTAWVAWGILCFSQAVGLWAGVWTCLLQGAGYVGWDALVASLVGGFTGLSQIIWVWTGGKLVGLAVIGAGGAILQRGLICRFVRRRSANVLALPGRWDSSLFRSLLPAAWRAWLTAIGYLLVANSDPFFIVSCSGTTSIPAYRAAFLLVVNLHLLAGVFSGASPVFVSRSCQAGQWERIRSILRRNAQVGLLAMGCGGGAIVALGPVLFETWLGPGNFVGFPILIIFLTTFMLEHHANVFGTCGRAVEDEAYAVSSLAAGSLKLALAWWLAGRFGLMGLALSTLAAQGLTNDWYMVYRSATRLGIRWREHAIRVLLPVFSISVATLLLCLWLHSLVGAFSPAFRIAVLSSAAGLVWLGSVLLLNLGTERRDRIFRGIILLAR